MEVIRLGTGLSIRRQGKEVLFIKEEETINNMEEVVIRILCNFHHEDDCVQTYEDGYRDGVSDTVEVE